MKIHNKIISVLLVFLIVVFGYCVILNASSLTFEKTAILDEGMAYYNVAYEKIRVLTHNDSGGKGNQQISYVKVGKDSLANIVVWTKTGKSALKGANLLDLAADFEKENPGWTVLAGINGDYYDPNTMIPINALVRNGDVIKPHNHMKYFSLGIGNNKEYIVSRNNRTENKYSLSVYNCTGRYIVKEFFLDNQNLPPAIDQTSFYYGNQQEQTIGAARHFVVECNECYNYGGFYCKGTVIDETDKVAVENDRLTIVTRDPAVAALLENKPPVRIQKSLCADNNGYNNIIGVGSEPLKDGSILSFSEIGDQNEAFAQARHPRSSIGFTDEGDVVIAAFDGRQSGIDGVNLREMALAMKSLGCKAAFNLDGGGSTQMIVRKDNVLQFLNSPSETYRRVANAILIVAPDIYVNAAYSDITASGLRLDYHIIPGRLVTVEAVRLLVDGDDYQSSSSPAVLNFSAPYGIHYFSFEVTYRKAGLSYTQVFYNNRINIANYNV
ncbi:MAG: phosphodiester glycosidase family protein, partial [Bacilli bacterium]|nr:phosphodiester glycosidase family protein [Bacilli bacterium]